MKKAMSSGPSGYRASVPPTQEQFDRQQKQLEILTKLAADTDRRLDAAMRRLDAAIAEVERLQRWFEARR
jgi:hypothetical protein